VTIRQPTKILFLITGLGRGGAENSLLQLMRGLPADRFSISLVSLQNSGDYKAELELLGISLTELHLDHALNWLNGIVTLWRCLKNTKPDVLVNWMYHANLVGGVMGFLARTPRILYNVRHSTISVDSLRFLTRLIVRFGALLARHGIAETVTFNSYRAAGIHVAAKYPLATARVIHNGFDLVAFQRDSALRAQTRRELKISDEKLVVGIIGRYDSVKNHAGFFRSIAEVMRKNAAVIAVAAGAGITAKNRDLAALMAELGIADKVLLLGKRDDVTALLNCCDVLVCSSFSESFPRILGEAMACETPCVSTDVGEARSILGNCGGVIAKEPEELGGAIEKLLSLSTQARAEIGQRGRARIQELFSEEQTIRRFIEQLDPR